jgi:cation diffusion facilitator family transporter
VSESIKAALTANACVAGAKTVGAYFTGSASMAAEAIHSFADCGNQLLLMWGKRTSDRKADKDHPFGYGMNVFFWSFIVALVLFSLGGTYSLYEGVHKLMNPEPLQHTGWAIAVLTLGFFLELRSFRTCLAEIRETYPGKNMFWFFKETRDPALLVIFGEDLAALLGLGIAAGFLGLALYTNNPAFDAMGSIAVGVLLIVVAIGLFIETKELLTGQSVDPSVRRALHQLLADFEPVEHTYECRTLQLGEDALLMIRARFREKENVPQLLKDINDLELAISEQFPQFTQIFVEPDDKYQDY